MSIQTGGFQVQAMPQYTPLDPNKVTFNPDALVHGALSSIGLLNELTNRKALLQQQQDLASTHDARIAAELAKLGITTQTAPGQIESTNALNLGNVIAAPALAQAQAAKAGTEIALAPGNTDLGLLSQQIKSGEGQFNLRLQPTLQEAAQLSAETQAAAAPYKSDAELAKAKLEASTAGEDLAAGDTSEQLLLKQKIASEEALAQQRTAEASMLTGRNATIAEAAALRAATHAQLDKSYGNARDTYKAISADLVREGSARAVDPTGANPQFTVAEAADAYNQSPTGFSHMLNVAIGAPDVKAPIPAGIKAQIDSYNELRKDAAEARRRMIEISKKTHSEMGYDGGSSQDAPPPIHFSMGPKMPVPASPTAPSSNALASLSQAVSSYNPQTDSFENAPAPAVQSAPANTPLTPAQAAALPSGTVFLGTDGKKHVRK